MANFSPIFPKKLHEIKEIWVLGIISIDPPLTGFKFVLTKIALRALKI